MSPFTLDYIRFNIGEGKTAITTVADARFRGKDGKTGEFTKWHY